jgi:pilus assembly protein Flp/PilA
MDLSGSWPKRQVCQSAVNSKNTEKVIAMKTIMNFLRDEEGLTTVEYAIAGGLVGAAVIGAFQLLGVSVGGVITNIDGALP